MVKGPVLSLPRLGSLPWGRFILAPRTHTCHGHSQNMSLRPQRAFVDVVVDLNVLPC